MDDEFELKITELSPGSPALDTPLSPASGKLAASENAGPFLAPRRERRRWRMWRGFVVGGIVIIALGILLASIPDVADVLPSLPWGAASTAVLSPAASLVYLEGGVPWGKLAIDGKPVALAHGARQMASFRLAPGTHILRYSAAPFAAVTCTISAPGLETDTCTEAFSEADNPPPLSMRILNLRETPDRLPADAYARLEAAVAASIANVAPPAVVRPGDRYQSARRAIATAAVPLPAQFALVLNSDTYNMVQTATTINCVTLCDDGLGTDTPQPYWFIAANVVPVWRYTAPDARTAEVPVQISIYNTGAGIPLDLSVQWDGAWHVAPFYGTASNALCFAAYSVFDPGPALEAGQSGGFTTSCAAGRDAGDGCLITLRPTAGDGTSAASAEYLYRFGLLLAANPAAHALTPEVPLANTTEQARAQQLASATLAAGA